MMEEYQSYIITALDAHTLDFEELKFMRANITTMRIIDPTSFEIMNGIWNSYLTLVHFKSIFNFISKQFTIGNKENDETKELST